MLGILLESILAAFVEAALPAAKTAERGKPLAQFVDEQREKHGFSDDWGKDEVVLTPEQWKRIDAAFAAPK